MLEEQDYFLGETGKSTNIMASEQQVKQYLAYWFQLGKKLVIRNGAESVLLKSVIEGDRYSAEFEAYWQRITAPDAGDCYLEGTEQTIQELLQPEWEVMPCARCAMPVPMRQVGMPPGACPCYDLSSWPSNNELPSPRSPIDSQARLTQIRDRLIQGNSSQPPNNSSSQNPPPQSSAKAAPGVYCPMVQGPCPNLDGEEPHR